MTSRVGHRCTLHRKLDTSKLHGYSSILIDHDANVNSRHLFQWTPIHFSAEHDHLELVKLLLERGADVHAMNFHGEMPYHLSLNAGHREMADFLRGYGTDRQRFADIRVYGLDATLD